MHHMHAYLCDDGIDYIQTAALRHEVVNFGAYISLLKIMATYMSVASEVQFDVAVLHFHALLLSDSFLHMLKCFRRQLETYFAVHAAAEVITLYKLARSLS